MLNTRDSLVFSRFYSLVLTNIYIIYATLVGDEDWEMFACSELDFSEAVVISQIRNRLVKSLTICKTDAYCCAIVVVQR